MSIEQQESLGMHRPDGDHGVPHRLSLRSQTVHAGANREDLARSLVTPLYQSTAFATDEAWASSQRREQGEPNYSRDRFPNVRELEQAVARLEGADSGCAASSGMATISLLCLTFLSAGDHVVLAEGSYCDTAELIRRVFAKFAVDLSVVDVMERDAVEQAILPTTRLLLVETIANPSMDVPDLDMLAGIAHRHDMLFGVDNTFATPMLCRPLEHDADLVIHSATKFLGGHHDLTAGVVVGQRDLINRVQETAYLVGTLPGAMDSWLALRGIRTLAPRISWISSGASEIARALIRHPAISELRYPGVTTGNGADIVGRMLPNGAGGMLAVRFFGGDEAACAFVSRLRLIPYVPSLGGTTTTVCFPPRSMSSNQNNGASKGWLRFSVGLESPDDLLADINQALTGLNEESMGRE